MHIRIRKFTSSTKDDDVVLEVSKTDTIEDLKEMIYETMAIEIAKQKLYYRGKELIVDHIIHEYDIKMNDVIQLLIRENDEIKQDNKESASDAVQENKEVEDARFDAESCYYKIGDRIDIIDEDHGAWFEAKILKIYKDTPENVREEDLIFKIQMDRNVETAPLEVKFEDIRPRSYYLYSYSELKPGMLVFVNYNIDEHSERGYWYDFEVNTVTNKSLKGTLIVGREQATIKNCSIKFINEVMKIEERVLLTERQEYPKDIPLRKLPLYCKKCKDDPTKKCKECGCKACAKKESEGILILCDECDGAFHLKCLSPPLTEVPKDNWYCPSCKIDSSEIVRAGEKLKKSTKKMKMPSYQEGGKKRLWGGGMGCASATKKYTILPLNHYGPIPGIEVGTCWKFRSQMGGDGVHRPQVAGIHGRESDGAYSIVLSGGYEDDVDLGEEFYYTGSGGRDLSGNKRVNHQSFDQSLTRTNKALALNCDCKFNDKVGGTANDWKKGKPVRVIRKCNRKNPSKYSPSVGYRYDGIYKVVKYFPEKGKSGFLVWRFLLRRDDPAPPPWSKDGQEFDVIVPEGFLEARNSKNKRNKRKLETSKSVSPKKRKIPPYKMEPEIKKIIKNDAVNKKLWDECKTVLNEGKLNYLKKVEELFMCVCCQEILFQPITVTCSHNVCKKCLKRSFAAGIYTCPWCRNDLGKNYVIKENENLGKALKALFPGYESGR